MASSSRKFNPYPVTYTLYIKIESSDPKMYKFLHDYYSTQKNGTCINLITPKTQPDYIYFEISTEMLDNDGFNVSYYLIPNFLKEPVEIIDAGYRGVLTAMCPPHKEYKGFNYYKGTEHFKICAPDLKPIQVKVVDELSM
jgi:hypothetical protein